MGVIDLTSARAYQCHCRTWFIPLTLALVLTSRACLLQAAVLPEDRLDVLYHAYDGGGAQIQGPSLLVRKAFDDTLSVSANYYVDLVSSASIDVQATASPYAEERAEVSLGVDYLVDTTTFSLGVTASEESDYSARSLGLSVSQGLFGDLTTLTLSASMGEDQVQRTGDDVFNDSVARRRFGLSLSQIVTKNLIIAANLEAVVDEGYLSNPYRTSRFLDPTSARGYSYQPERYPRTRNSDALALKAMYYLPWHASLGSEWRYFTDSWSITANNVELRYVHPVSGLAEGLTLEMKLRAYNQTGADFYSDLYDFRNSQNFLARDKELSDFTSRSLGVGISYEIPSPFDAIHKSSVNLYWDYMQFRYTNFRDVTAGGAPGQEPLYGFDANVIRLFFSIWY